MDMSDNRASPEGYGGMNVDKLSMLSRTIFFGGLAIPICPLLYCSLPECRKTDGLLPTKTRSIMSLLPGLVTGCPPSKPEKQSSAYCTGQIAAYLQAV